VDLLHILYIYLTGTVVAFVVALALCKAASHDDELPQLDIDEERHTYGAEYDSTC